MNEEREIFNLNREKSQTKKGNKPELRFDGFDDECTAINLRIF